MAVRDRDAAIAHCGSGPRRDRPASSSRVAPFSKGCCRILALLAGPDKPRLRGSRKSRGFLPGMDEGLQFLFISASGKPTGGSLLEIRHSAVLSWATH